jgi:hypothetical protein
MIEGRPRSYADENMDLRIIETLRGQGFDIVAAGDVAMLGQDDAAQTRVCRGHWPSPPDFQSR